MDLRQIRYFVAVYEEGSISRAAAREHCTQPGISVQIQKLEGELDQQLFERRARGVVPTLAGRHLYECCVGVLEGIRAARQRMLDLAGSVSGRIRIGVAPTLCQGALPRVLPTFLAEHPFVEVRVSEAFSGTLTQWVVEDEVDVAIVTEPPVHLGLTTTPFFRDELVLVQAPGRATRRLVPRSWSDLAAMKLVLPSEKHGLRGTIATSVRLGGADGRQVEVDGMLATLELVRASDWVTVLPVCAVFERVQRGELVAERFGEGGVALDFYLVHTNAEPVSVAARLLIDMLRRTAEEIAASWRASLPDRRTPDRSLTDRNPAPRAGRAPRTAAKRSNTP